ncbi:hypothetical protein SAMN05443582_102532 [Phyllobacterium sp. OV277]|nr:hypothetical protein SAMN05443582_102532 [Phyllobacterium sp. OV277]
MPLLAPFPNFLMSLGIHGNLQKSRFCGLFCFLSRLFTHWFREVRLQSAYGAVVPPRTLGMTLSNSDLSGLSGIITPFFKR